MNFSDDFRRCLVECDVATMRRLWQHVQPNLPQPESDAEILATIHRARTETKSISMRLRAYSHRWCCDHDIPSALPDKLKPKAERLYPKVVGAVGISVRSITGKRSAFGIAMQGAMSDAVLEAYADGREEPEFVKDRMMAAKDKFIRQA